MQLGLRSAVLLGPAHPPAHPSQRGLQDPGCSATRGRSGAGLHDLTVMVSYRPASRRTKQTLKSPPELPNACSVRLGAPSCGQRAQRRRPEWNSKVLVSH